MNQMTSPDTSMCGLEAASEGDRIWFEAHLHRRFRVRPYIEGEWPDGALDHLPQGQRWFTVVRQVEPGVRMRISFPMEGEPGTGEHAVSRIFDLLMRGAQ
jgi:hypothetical protein